MAPFFYLAGKAIMAFQLHPDYLVGQHLSDYDFNLPEELIAQYPLADRTASRLLHVTDSVIEDLHFTDVKKLLRPGDLLVMNDTKVIKARLRGHKDTGGAVEFMIERVTGEKTALSMLRASKTPKTGSRLFAVNDKGEEAPLPPYIEREAKAEDAGRYQTVYAKCPGAVAAPTAGLHFTKELLAELKDKGVDEAFVTLHVGAGTFQPVREENLEEHTMHSEWLTVSEETAEKVNRAKREGRRVIAVGSTSLRALESAAVAPGVIRAGAMDTKLFIAPGYKFDVIDVMITNFHLPKSTLVMLVSAIVGRDRVMQAYRHAVDNKYRFFSYGDACFFELPEKDRARPDNTAKE